MVTAQTLPHLTKAAIQQWATEQSFQRGESYYRNGAIINPMRQEFRLWASCAGSEMYETSVTLDQKGVHTSSCTCPYDWGGICKHQVALLLTYAHAPESFDVIPPIAELLKSHSRADLVNLVEQMLQRHPALLSLVEVSAPLPSAQSLDLSTYRKQAQRALRQQDIEPIVEALKALEKAATKFLQTDDRANAGSIYQILLSQIVTSYDWNMRELDYDGDLACLVNDFTDGLAACLGKATNLDSPTRKLWLMTFLEAFLKDLEMGGIDFAYGAKDCLIEFATEAEWQDLEDIIHQEIAKAGAQKHSQWEREALVRLLSERLTVTDQPEAAAALMLDLGSPQQRAFLLLERGQFEAAVAIAQQHFTQLPGLMTQFANALVTAGATEQALQYAMSQEKEGSRWGYDEWLAEYYQKHGDSPAALQWQQKFFMRSPNLERYKQLHQLAEPVGTWKSIRLDALKHLENQKQTGQLIDIALYETDVDRALQLLSELSGWGNQQYLLRVAETAEKHKPSEAIALYQPLVTAAIGQKNRSAYQTAVEYLKKIKPLYAALGRQEDWQYYLQDLRTKYPTLRALHNELDRAKL